MLLAADTARVFVDQAFDGLLRVVDRLGDDLVNVKPVDPDTTSVAALVVHCCGVAEYWLSHVALGDPSERDRDAEFAAVASVAALHERVASARVVVAGCLDRLEGGDGTDPTYRPPVWGGDTSDAAIALHVVEELFQHLGHAELSADVLLGASA
jgi:phage gp36-like protein